MSEPRDRDRGGPSPLPRDDVRDQSRSRVVAALRRGPMTLDQLVEEIGLTRTAIRLHLATLERDGLVARRGVRAGRTKPSHVYELTQEAEHQLSRAYIPVLTQLVQILANGLPPAEFDALMRDVGRGLLSDVPRPRGPLRDRAEAASQLLNQLGGLTSVEQEDGMFIIRSYGCPLAATAVDHPETCNAMETLVSEFVGATVAQRCDRSGRPRCCFEIVPGDGETAAEYLSFRAVRRGIPGVPIESQPLDPESKDSSLRSE